MTDTPLNVTVVEPEDVSAPVRAIPGGAVQDAGGVVRSTPGVGPAEDLGSGKRAQVTPGQAAPEVQDTQSAGEGEDTTRGAEGQDTQADGEGDDTQPPSELDARLAPYTEEVTSTGTLSDESVAKAAKEFGVSEDMVRQYLAGAQAQGAQSGPSPAVQATVNAAYELVGGQEHYAGFNTWLAEQASDDDMAALKAAADTSSPAVLKAVMAPWVQRWKEGGNGPQPRQARHEGAAATQTGEAAIEGFASREDQLAAIRDPRYSRDPAYRSQVDQRIVVSTWARAR